MLRVPVQKIRPGMVLARPIHQPQRPEHVLLARHREIPMDLAVRLEGLGVSEVWVSHGELEFLEDIIDEGLSERQREVYQHVRHCIEAIMGDSAIELELVRFQQSIRGLFDYLKQNPSGSIFLQKIDTFDNNYLMAHSANVCYLAILLGMHLEAYLAAERTGAEPATSDLQLLGLGCLLHDLGKIRIPREILHKPSGLTADEMRVMRLHPLLGYDMVRGRVPAEVAGVVLHHHQRWGGGGYPALNDPKTGQERPPLCARQIPIFARIASVVDVYDAATSRRLYSDAKLPVQVLHEMRAACRGFFDPTVEAAFYQIMPPFPIGQVVTLSNGAEAVVVDFNSAHPIAPKVQVLKAPSGETYRDPAQQEIDLSGCPDVQVVVVNGIDVRPFLSPSLGLTGWNSLGLPALV